MRLGMTWWYSARWIWFFWANPLEWAQNALLINEFSAGHWQTIAAPDGSAGGLGVFLLKSKSIHTDYWSASLSHIRQTWSSSASINQGHPGIPQNSASLSFTGGYG